MRRNVLLIALGMCLLSLKASITANFNYGIFNVPKQNSFIESYITIIGRSAYHQSVSGGYQASVNIKVNIYKAADIIKTNSYNLLSPVDKDTTHFSNFIDDQRYALSNGTYVFELTLTDNNDPNKKSFSLKETFTIDYNESALLGSTIQILESYSKASSPTVLTKSGYDLIPYNVNYFPQNLNKLSFYFESYNADTVLGKNKNFIYRYYVQNKEDLKKIEGLIAFKKQSAAKVNPILASLDISNLESGNYYLVIEMRDEKNILQLEKKWFFQRSKPVTKAMAYKVQRTANEFFGDYSNADTLKMFVESLWPVSQSDEREWEINQTIRKDPMMMKNFIVDFWTKRAGDTLDPLQMWLSYYAEVKKAHQLFHCGKQQGYYTDRGRVYLQYGPPNQRVQQPSEPNAYPYEIWQYYRIKDKVTGQFYSNKKFVFVNANIADNCYKLIHSTMRGEPYDDKWQYQISKRAPDNGNVDQTQPSQTYGSQALDLFNNPR
jgi:GWxTD domain-containing protein